VTVTTQEATARVLLVVMAPWAGTVGVVPSLLALSYGGIGAADMHEPSVEEPCMELPSQLRRDLAGSSAGWRQELHL
jgi:hypothetical protein